MKVTSVRFVQGRNHYGTSRKYAVAIHATANTAPAVNEASYAARRTDGTSSHFYVDDETIIQSLDTTLVAGHAGNWQGNQNAIAVEVTGLNAWTRQQWMQRVDWTQLARTLAAVCRYHGIPARRATVAQMRSDATVRGFYTHDDMRRAWAGTDHTDPGPNFPMDHLIAKVAEVLGGEDDDMPLTDKDIPLIQRAIHGTKIGRTGKTFGQAMQAAVYAPEIDAAARKELDAKLDLLRAEIKGEAAAIKAKQDALAAAAEQRAKAEEARDAALLAAVTADDTVPPAEVPGGGTTRPGQ